MQAYKVSFNVYAESQEEADKVSRMMADFVDNYGRSGIAVTAGRILSIPRHWLASPFVTKFFTK